MTYTEANNIAYSAIFARSFSKHDQKKLRFGAFVGCLLIAFSLCTVFKPAGLNPLPVSNLPVSLDFNLKMLETEEIQPQVLGALERQPQKPAPEEVPLEAIRGELDQPLITTSKPQLLMPNLSVSLDVNLKMPGTEEIQPQAAVAVAVAAPEVQPQAPAPEEVSQDASRGELDQTVSKPELMRTKVVVPKAVCNISGPRSDGCEMTGDIRIHSNSSRVFVSLTDTAEKFPTENNSWTIKPYARKGDNTAMAGVREVEVKIVRPSSSQVIPKCTQNHSVPSIVFSTGGYAGNHFHDFTDVVVPLYLTSREFDGQVQFLVTNKQSWWINKYKKVLHKLSRYEIIDIDKEETGVVHCFPRMVVGLQSHKEFDIDPSRSPYYSMTDFRKFLREAYSLKRENAIKLIRGRRRSNKRPRLLIISRRRTRAFLNEKDIVRWADTLGFEVVVTEADGNVARFASLVNTCDVMMGVHGAGLSNMLFLPENAVLIQIVPLGKMEWLARTDFGEPSKGMNLRYLEYNIGEEESSLTQEYPLEILRDPSSLVKQGWAAYGAVFLEKQNVKLDLGRFRATLLEAQKLLHW